MTAGAWQKLQDSWRALGHDEEVPFSAPLAVLMTAYSVLASVGWYAIRGTEWSAQLNEMGLNRSRLAILLIWGGVALFLLLLWWLRERPPWSLRGETLMVMIGSMVLLTVFWLYGRRSSFVFWFGYRPPWGGHHGMLPFYFFTVTSVFTRVICPIVLIVFLFKRQIGDFGYRVKGLSQGWWVYAVLAAFVMLLVVFYASTLPAFLKKYPWCKQGVIDGQLDGTLLGIYLLASFAFYASGEAFWRGFILFGVFRELGRNSLFFMLMPYVLGHLGKPLPETLGAVLAGLVLGVLALQHRSFWLGAVTHWVIAMTMDFSALYRRGVEIVFNA